VEFNSRQFGFKYQIRIESEMLLAEMELKLGYSLLACSKLSVDSTGIVVCVGDWVVLCGEIVNFL
jgi:hypothetical protein